MDPDQGSEFLALEKALYDESMEPAPLSLSLLKAITKNFSKGEQIGSGGFGEVYKGELRNGTVAVKRLYSAIVIDEKNFQSEVDSLLGVRHKNTVRFLGYCSDTQQVMDKFNGATVWAEQRQRLLCFEFLPKGSLADYIKDASSGLQWRTRYQIIKGISEGVHYLHQKHIVHMDLKPQNILLDGNMMPKIADFGLSRRLSENQSRDITKNIAGTWGYLAPEFLESGEITFKTDIYSLGVIFIEMLMGSKGSAKVEEVLESWTNVLGTPESHIPLEQLKICAEIGIQCMDHDPENRPSTWDIILRLFDEEEISNWSARGVISISSMAQEMPLIAKLEYELKLMNLYGRPFLPKRVSPLKGAGETSTETIHLGFTDSEILDVHPLELRFPFETDKRTNCPLSLTNKTDQHVFFCIISELKGMYSCEEDEAHQFVSGHIEPMSTYSVSIRLVEQQQRPLNMMYILLIMFESSVHHDFMSYVTWGDLMGIVDLPQRVEEMGCQMHVAMLTGVVCPQSETTKNPKMDQRIFTDELESINTMDVHPTEPWILMIQNRRKVSILDYETQAVVMSFKSSEKQGWIKSMLDADLHIHAAKFIPRKQWFVTGDDSGNVRVYSYVTRKEIHKFSAYFRSCVCSLAVHPTYPLLITLSPCDPHAIRLWDWEMGWKCSRRINRGHQRHLDNRFRFNPKDATTFAGASEACQVWSIHSSEPLITLLLHPGCHKYWHRFIVCDYLYTSSHQQLIVSTRNNGDLTVWDSQTGACVHTLVLCDKPIIHVACHPALPLIVAGSLDGECLIVCFWNSNNYRLLKTVRCTHGPKIDEFRAHKWFIHEIVDIAFVGSRRLVIGYSDGIEVLEMDLEALSRQQ